MMHEFIPQLTLSCLDLFSTIPEHTVLDSRCKNIIFWSISRYNASESWYKENDIFDKLTHTLLFLGVYLLLQRVPGTTLDLKGLSQNVLDLEFLIFFTN